MPVELKNVKEVTFKTVGAAFLLATIASLFVGVDQVFNEGEVTTDLFNGVDRATDDAWKLGEYELRNPVRKVTEVNIPEELGYVSLVVSAPAAVGTVAAFRMAK